MKAALYRAFDSYGRLLYVGISGSAFHRLIQHERNSGWFPEVANITIEWFPNRQEAKAAETAAIKNEDPQYNVSEAQRYSFLERELPRVKSPYIDICEACFRGGYPRCFFIPYKTTGNLHLTAYYRCDKHGEWQCFWNADLVRLMEVGA